MAGQLCSDTEQTLSGYFCGGVFGWDSHWHGWTLCQAGCYPSMSGPHLIRERSAEDWPPEQERIPQETAFTCSLAPPSSAADCLWTKTGTRISALWSPACWLALQILVLPAAIVIWANSLNTSLSHYAHIILVLFLQRSLTNAVWYLSEWRDL